MGSITQIPFVFTLSFYLFFYYVGYSFFAGIAVFVLAFIVNFIFGCCLSKIQKTLMRRKDKRMRETNEALNHIKSLKLNSW